MLLSGTTACAAASLASERERLEGFAAFVQDEGLIGSIVGYGEADEDGNVSFPKFLDARVSDLLIQMKQMEAEYGPAVKDVVTVIRAPKQEERRLAEMAALSREAAAQAPIRAMTQTADGQAVTTDPVMGPVVVYDPEAERAAAQVTQTFIRQAQGFPTTDWQRFGSELVDLGTFTLTAYDPCIICCGKTDGITATGTKGQTGRTIAVDPSVIPYGSRVLIGGYVFIAEDTGSAIRGNHIDLFMDTHEIATQFGKRQAQVQLIQ